MKRGSGILLPIFSLPSKHGIGSLGHEAYRFVDFLHECGQIIWQILPLGPTHEKAGNSPYSSLSSFAGDPIYIDLDILQEEGLLQAEDYDHVNYGKDPSKIDYDMVRAGKLPILIKAFSSFNDMSDKVDFEAFIEEHRYWLDDYALYMAISQKYGFSWPDWPKALRSRDKKALEKFAKKEALEISFQKFLQYIFFKQYLNLKAYAKSRGISIIGDLPIYTPLESADCWDWPQYFQLDKNFLPVFISGVPPDRYSEKGQVWNHPLYNWAELKKFSYDYWVQRVKINQVLYDYLRLDHFIGFVNYYAIPYGDTTAVGGHWEKGPGQDLFKVLKKELEHMNLIAEDLGAVTQEVTKLKDKLGFPGMRVIQFGFGGKDNPNLPHNYDKNTLAYSSTQDSDTFMGWLNSVSEDERNRALQYLGLTDYEGYHWGCVRYLMSGVNVMSIFQLQDILGMGSEGRINVPGVEKGCWEWRCSRDYYRADIISRIKTYMEIYKRLPKRPRKSNLL